MDELQKQLKYAETVRYKSPAKIGLSFALCLAVFFTSAILHQILLLIPAAMLLLWGVYACLDNDVTSAWLKDYGFKGYEHWEPSKYVLYNKRQAYRNAIDKCQTKLRRVADLNRVYNDSPETIELLDTIKKEQLELIKLYQGQIKELEMQEHDGEIRALLGVEN